ncbi:MAG TPA: hypothetical protein VL995_21065 [Cellvibrio sp.]|nr:hypothetical protein [Cellvibrio sp.]
MEKSPEREFCILAQRALAVANCTQVLTEAGHQILSVSITEKDAVVSIGYSMKTKKLRGVVCGATYHKGALHVVYQRDVRRIGEMVRTLF